MANTGPRIVVAQSIAMVNIAPNLTANPVPVQTILVVPDQAKGQTMTDLAQKDPTGLARIAKRIDPRIPRATRPRYVVSRLAPSPAGQL